MLRRVYDYGEMSLILVWCLKSLFGGEWDWNIQVKWNLVKVNRTAQIWRSSSDKQKKRAGDRVERWLLIISQLGCGTLTISLNKKKDSLTQSSGGNTTLVWNDLNIDVRQWSQENFILNPQMRSDQKITGWLRAATTPVTRFITWSWV